MKIVLLSVLCFVAACAAVEQAQLDLAEWENFKITHEKTYATAHEELKRKAIFMDNLSFIREHNKRYENGEETYTVSMNHFGDLTNKEFGKMMNRYRAGMSGGLADKVHQRVSKDIQDLPASVDWRDQGYVTPVKNQGYCGSCWAFSTTGSLEGQHFNKTGKLVSLSEQNLVDCALPDGEKGCSGYWMSEAFEYIIKNNGIDTEAAYPYTGYDGTCQFAKKSVGAKLTSYVNVTSGSEDDLQDAVANVGPVSVAIDASHIGFQFYFYGVYKAILCGTSVDSLDHGVLVVGYGHKDGLFGGDYWIVKNSWGSSWGMKGYILMGRNRNNMCGIATCASYPVV